MERVPSWRELTVRLDPQGGRRPGAVQLMVREANASPRFASIQLWADPFTGRILREERWADLSPGEEGAGVDALSPYRGGTGCRRTARRGNRVARRGGARLDRTRAGAAPTCAELGAASDAGE